ncbi:MAG: carotenoid oxygenase family protein [Planctomycetota bacterium]
MKRPLCSADFPALADNPQPWAGMVTSLPDEHDYVCDVEGDLPDLRGRLYRQGPGLYDRGPDRKRMLLDGDGMTQMYDFDGGRVRFRNRYVRTAKYLEEGRAGRFLHPTFSTHGSGPKKFNFRGDVANQANVTCTDFFDGKVLAFDDGQKPTALGRDDLETLGETDLDYLRPGLRFWAHFKEEPAAGLFHALAMKIGRFVEASVVSLDRTGSVVARSDYRLPRACYVHDWIVTSRYFGFVLHPAIINLWSYLKVRFAHTTFADAIDWRPQMGNLILLFDRETGRESRFKAAGCWVWHCVNAFDEGDDVVVDFVGGVSGLGGADAPFYTVMRNEVPPLDETVTNPLRRYRLDPRRESVTEEVLDDSLNFELPTVPARDKTVRPDRAFVMAGVPGELFARGVGSWDYCRETFDRFVFDDAQYTAEPVPLGDRHVATQVYVASEKRSYLGIFRGDRLADGPVAKVWHTHHVPLSFHGCWSPK